MALFHTDKDSNKANEMWYPTGICKSIHSLFSEETKTFWTLGETQYQKKNI